MAYDPNVATFLLFSNCGKTLGKNTFSQHPLQKWQCGNFADSDVYITCSWCVDFPSNNKDGNIDFFACIVTQAVGDNTWAYFFGKHCRQDQSKQ